MGRHRRVEGRLRVSPWFSVAVLLVAGFTLLRLYDRARPGGWRIQSGADDLIVDSRISPTVGGWVGRTRLPTGGQLEASITPYHANPSLQRHRSSSLSGRLGLGEGELWRLELRFTPKADEGLTIALEEVSVADEAGVVLVSLDQAILTDAENDPLATLMRDTRLQLGPGEAETIVLWGKRPWGQARLAIVRGEDVLKMNLDPTDIETAELERWLRGAHTAAVPSGGRAGSDERDAEIARLKEQLQEEQDRRRERELEWYEYNRALAQLNVGNLQDGLRFGVDEELVPSDEDDPAEAAEPGVDHEEPVDPARLRADEIRLALSTLFKLEGLYGLDLLEAGVLGEGWVGPVVFRTLDERGRLTGSVVAERLRLEASRTARTLTVVLEEGYESRQGREYPFAGGVRRITLPYVDPEPWIESASELFDDDVKSPINDDGLWDLIQVRSDFNRLLGLDTSAGWFRIKGIGGVMGTELMDVHLEEFDSSGRLRRRIFADRMSVRLQEAGVQISLSDGAIVRGDEKESFGGGTHQIFLPSSARKEWAAARLPGLVEAQKKGTDGVDEG